MGIPLDRNIRLMPDRTPSQVAASQRRLAALVETACRMLVDGAPPTNDGELHRLSKMDTEGGS